MRKFVLCDINNKMIEGENLRLTFVCDFKLNETQEKIIKEMFSPDLEIAMGIGREQRPLKKRVA